MDIEQLKARLADLNDTATAIQAKADSEKRDLSDTALQAWLNDIAAVFNTHAVPRLFALNGESLENLPTLVPGELRPTDVEEFATALKDAAAGGYSFVGDADVEAEVRRRLGLPAQLPEEQQTREPMPEPSPNGVPALNEPAPSS